MRERYARCEWAVVTIAVWLGLAALSLSDGGIGLSWDAINHHIYLGWTAMGHRFGQDVLAANYQSLQFPYIYVPAYLLAVHGAGPLQAAIALSALHALAAPALWLVSRSLIPGTTWEAVAMRALAVLLGYLSPVVLSLSDNTANDLLAAIPLVWAVALATLALEPQATATLQRRLTLGSGLLAGMAVAFKLSNGPLVLLMPLLWMAGARALPARVGRVLQGGVATLVGFVVSYGYWGWVLWSHFGNPFYPFFEGPFELLRQALGWSA